MASLAKELLSAAHSNPSKTLLVHGDQRLTYQELFDRSARIAAGLHRLGVRSKDRVAFALGNTPDFVAMHYAALISGAVSVPINPSLKASELRPFLASVAPRLIVAGQDCVNEVMAAGPHSFPVFVIGSHLTARPFSELETDQRLEVSDVAPDDAAVLAYTSGTAGLPKAAILTHANLSANLDQMSQVTQGRIEPDDVLLGVLPLFHIYGLNVVLGMAVREGATVVLEERFEPASSMATIRREGVTVIVGAPPMFVAWLALPEHLKSRIDSARFAVSGASALAPQVITDFRSAFGVEIWEGYGLTETAPAVTSTRMGEQRPGSVGKLLPGVEVRVVDGDGEGVIAGDVGEIWVRGPNVFGGYWGADEATDAVFSGDWFRTGDLGYFDDDGYLWLVDRMKELIIVSGFNVYPREVEEVLTRHPDVMQAAVLGVSHPLQGESVKALVVLGPGSSSTAEDLIVHCAQNLARYKVPAEIEIVPELPRLPSGKVLKRLLRPSELGPAT